MFATDFRSVGFLLCLVLVLLAANMALAGNGIYITAPTGTFSPANTLTSLTFTVTDKGGFTTPASTISLQFQNSAGTAIGAPVSVTVGAGGVVTVPAALIPAGATGLGNKVVAKVTESGVDIETSKPIIWYNAAWFYGTTAAVKLDPVSLPGYEDQSWFIDEMFFEVTVTMPDGHTKVTVVNDSLFQLYYTSHGGGLFGASVTGDNSHISCADGSYAAFASGTSFGSITQTFNDGATAGGTFDFSAIGLSGTWNWLAGSNYTSAIANLVNGFWATTITVVPEPSSILALGATLCTLAGGLRLRKR